MSFNFNTKGITSSDKEPNFVFYVDHINTTLKKPTELFALKDSDNFYLFDFNQDKLFVRR